MTALSLPSTLTAIPDYAFTNANEITELVIPDTVESIGANAFAGWNGLKKLTIPVEHLLNDKAFYAQGLSDDAQTKNIEEMTVTAGRTGQMADLDSGYYRTPAVLSAGSLKTVTLENGITNIGSYAFFDWYGYSKSLDSFTINIPSSVTSIGEGAFRNHLLTGKLVVSPYVRSIGASAFTGTGLPITVYPYSYALDYAHSSNVDYLMADYSTLQLPDMVAEIEEESFAGTNAQMVVLPDLNVSILSKAFADSAVCVVIVPNGDTVIDDSAFAGCRQITIVCSPESSVSDWAQEHGYIVYDIQ